MSFVVSRVDGEELVVCDLNCYDMLWFWYLFWVLCFSRCVTNP